MSEVVDTSSRFRLTNKYGGPNKALAVSGTALLMVNARSDTSQTWYFTETRISKKYRLQTVASGIGKSLDVYNDEGVNSTNLIMDAINDYSGQFWNFVRYSDGTYRLYNDFTGPARFLEVYADTLGPHLSSPGSTSGQYWYLNNLDDTNNPSSSSVPPVVVQQNPTTTTKNVVTITENPTTITQKGTTFTVMSPQTVTTNGQGGDPTNAAPSGADATSPRISNTYPPFTIVTTTSSSAHSSSSSLSTGAIVGVAFGGLLSIALIALAAFFLIQRHKPSRDPPPTISEAGIGKSTNDYGQQSWIKAPELMGNGLINDPMGQAAPTIRINEIDGRMRPRHELE